MTAEREEWFKWEREGCVYQLDACANAAFAPLQAFFGKPFPDTVMIFRGDVVLWCNELHALRSLGQEMIDVYIEPSNREEMLREWSKREEVLRAAFKKTAAAAALGLEKISDAELKSLYLELDGAYAAWYAIGWLAEPVSWQGEELVSGLLKKKGFDERGANAKEFKRLFSLLTCTPRKSFNRREEEEFFELAATVKKTPAKKQALLAAHAEKWFWLHNNYLESRVLDAAVFDRELERVLAKHSAPDAYAQALRDSAAQLARDKREAIARLGLSGGEGALVELVDVFGWFQDHRKEVILQAVHFLDVLITEIGRRRGFAAREIKQLTRPEVSLLFEGSAPDRALIAERLKNCVIVWNGSRDSPEVWSGAAAVAEEKRLLKNYFGESGSAAGGEAAAGAREVVEIRGSVACQGKARGYARVTMRAAEANASLRSGEILVTSMTTPDFVTAVKRAGGIVTNEGGVTCHAAIVSREFGIPCVVGTRIATRVIKTGDFVEVDGNHGVVRKLVNEK
jgi:phosphohistidine swiveling domain-containing protein